ncbi:MAG: DNA polymerase I [Eubacteriales bacterium]
MKLLVLDGNSILNRAFYGVTNTLTTQSGQPTNAIFGFLTILNKLVKEETPDALCVTFDLKGPTFRHNLTPDYKATRKGMPDDLASQLPLLKEVLSAMNIPHYAEQGWEADDLLGTIARICEGEGWETVIVTGDKDSLQLITEKVRVNLVSSRMGKTTTKKMTPTLFFEEYGFDPIHLIDLKAIMGDTSDNIAGVKGVGEKSAIPLIVEHKSIDEIYRKLKNDDSETLGLKPAMLKKMREGEDSARLSYTLATIRTDAPITFQPDQNKIKPYDNEALLTLFRKLEFYKLIKTYGLSETETPDDDERNTVEICTSEVVIITDLEDCRKLISDSLQSPTVEVLALPNLQGVSIQTNHQGVARCSIIMETAFADYHLFLQEFFTSPSKKIVHGSRKLIFDLLQEGITPSPFHFDTEIAAYLLDPTAADYDLEKLSERYCNFTICNKSDYLNAEAFAPLSDHSIAYGSLASHSALIAALYEILSPKLENLSMNSLFNDVEMPLSTILAQMEHEGFTVDRQAITSFGLTLKDRLTTLEAEIYQQATQTFNINSPKQLGHILFEILGLPPSKKTKTGYSTNVEVLEKLDHPIIPLLLEYRTTSKLNSTYVEGLLKVVDHNSKIHTSFQNTVTATGRLSSTEPNLQNIPIRTPLGAKMREMFVAEPDMVLIDADYSQIELRLLAHMAKDETMIAAFQSGEDIHAQTAAQVFGVDLPDVTPLMRRSAKAVNFGIVYGISPFSLSQDIGVSVPEAKSYIERYFATYHGIKSYMEQVVEQAKTDGYVTTLLGRRRWIPELSSSNFNMRSFGERIALNMPIQGTAADIIKLAMIAVSNALIAEGLSAKLILQVHDELLVQAPKSEADQVATLLQREMEGVLSLAIPLKADTTIGRSWAEAH